MKSIMQEKDGSCYLCMKLHDDYSVKPCDEHHVMYGWANRRLSEKYGLKVYLCRNMHHEYGKEAVHINPKIRQDLCADGQRAFERHYQELNFREIFGKNWLDEKAVPIKEFAMGEAIEGFSVLPDFIEEDIDI